MSLVPVLFALEISSAQVYTRVSSRGNIERVKRGENAMSSVEFYEVRANFHAARDGDGDDDDDDEGTYKNGNF